MTHPVTPPYSIVWTVDRWAPGVYRDFWSALVGGLQGMPVAVTSYWRDPATNRAVNGARDSQHLIGLGIDLVPADTGEAASALGARGLVVVPYPTHLHVQAWPAGVARRSGLLDVLGL